MQCKIKKKNIKIKKTSYQQLQARHIAKQLKNVDKLMKMWIIFRNGIKIQVGNVYTIYKGTGCSTNNIGDIVEKNKMG